MNFKYSAGMKRVFLVEDDQDMASLLEIHLDPLNIKISHFNDGMEALKDIESSSYDFQNLAGNTFPAGTVTR